MVVNSQYNMPINKKINKKRKISELDKSSSDDQTQSYFQIGCQFDEAKNQLVQTDYCQIPPQEWIGVNRTV